jgi:hypothetical protein
LHGTPLDLLYVSCNEVTYLKEILPETYGAIFLGTPHRVSSIASIGTFTYEITKILWKKPNVQILQDLRRSPQALDRIGKGFSETLAQTPLKVHYFGEQLSTHGFLVYAKFDRFD